jgi:lipoprotein-anchoring transpeptidase ErfK/SrfK
VVLKTSGTVEADGRTWYKIVFNEWIRYPERLSKNLYVASEYVRPMSVLIDVEGDATNTKRIIIDRSEQMLYAYDGDELFMKEKVSTGLKGMETPRGNFTIFSKLPSRYMQGPLPGISDQEYDLPGVPWTMYFTKEGGAIHGAYWHNKFGTIWSHGCVNLPIDKSEELYKWAPLGTKVLVQE